MKLFKIFTLIFIFCFSFTVFNIVFGLEADEQVVDIAECLGGKVGDLFVCGVSASDPEANKVSLIIEELPAGLKIKRGDELEDLVPYDSIGDFLNLSCLPHFHKETDSEGHEKCVSNIDTTYCESHDENVRRVERYWNQVEGGWSDCLVVECAPGYIPNNNQTGCEIECPLENFDNAYSVEVQNNECIITQCDYSYHVEITGNEQECISNIDFCDIDGGNGARGQKTWNDGWGDCIGDANSCNTNENYPFFDANRQTCVNACGFIDGSTQVTFTFTALCLEDLYVPNYNVEFYAGDEDIAFKSFSTETCPDSSTVSTTTLENSRFISDSLLSSKCKYTTKPYNMGDDITVVDSGVGWTKTEMKNLSCEITKASDDKTHYLVVHTSSTMVKEDYSYIGTDFGKNACGNVPGWNRTICFADRPCIDRF